MKKTVRKLKGFRGVFIRKTVPTIKFSNVTMTLLKVNDPVKVLFTTLLFDALGVNKADVPLVSKIPMRVISVIVTSVVFFINTDCVVQLLIGGLPGIGGGRIT